MYILKYYFLKKGKTAHKATSPSKQLCDPAVLKRLSNSMNETLSSTLAGRLHTREQHGVLVCRLPDVVRLPSQRRLVDLHVVPLDQDSVSGEKITCSNRKVQLVDLRVAEIHLHTRQNQMGCCWDTQCAYSCVCVSVGQLIKISK